MRTPPEQSLSHPRLFPFLTFAAAISECPHIKRRAAFKEAFVELLISNATPDWKGRETTTTALKESQRKSSSPKRAQPTVVAKTSIETQQHVNAVKYQVPAEVHAESKDTTPPKTTTVMLQAKAKSSKFWGDARTVILHREPNKSFGISIVGGRVEVSQKGGLPGTGNTVSGIFIKSVLPNSPAGKSGSMNMGDRVISVNDIDLRDATHEYAVQVIKNAANPVKFVVQSLQSFSTTNAFWLAKLFQLTLKVSPRQAKQWCSSDLRRAPTRRRWRRAHTAEQQPSTSRRESTPTVTIAKAISEEPESSAEQQQQPEEETTDGQQPPFSDERRPSGVLTMADLRGRKVDPREMERRKIERSSAAYLQRLVDDPEQEDRFFYTKNKIARKYGDLPGEPILIRLEDIPPGGLGLSLAGNRDRDKMSVFVVAIKSTSPLPLKIGDELLEINGKVLFGLSHVNASSKIRECCDENELELLILRRYDALEEMAVRPEDQPSTSAAAAAAVAGAPSAAPAASFSSSSSKEKETSPSKLTDNVAPAETVVGSPDSIITDMQPGSGTTGDVPPSPSATAATSVTATSTTATATSITSDPASNTAADTSIHRKLSEKAEKRQKRRYMRNVLRLYPQP
ncbi:hypothetical protein L596_000246 [Steinernema carpocapsae]|uniref:PDZ domain-containing protein n=1 Tax=Steinernema carpocapsae TaxID=34508 RepID=A0A4U8UHR7_STECR|nr:hypothetical protein L596_000246 [Steinernema carpocapsae]